MRRSVPRVLRPRSLGLFFLILCLAGFSGVFGAWHCCGVGVMCPDPGDPPPNLPPGGGGPTYSWSIYRSQFASPWHADGQYGINITSTAHAIRSSDAYKKLFD